MKNLTHITSAVSAAFLLASIGHADVLFVNANLASGSSNGEGWSNAFQGPLGLQAAIAAAIPGDQIYVAQGVYKPTAGLDRTISFEWKAGIKIHGGFLGSESDLHERPSKGMALTILSGDLDGNDPGGPVGLNSYHVVHAIGTDADSLLDRLVIEGGFANGVSTTSPHGGGLFSDQVDAIRLVDCQFRGNAVSVPVGGGYVGNGGGAYLSATWVEVLDCEFLENSAWHGGGAYVDTAVTCRVDRCKFYDNDVRMSGGGLFVDRGDSVDIHNSLFARNSRFARKIGGGMFLDTVTAARVINCTVAFNSFAGSFGTPDGYGIYCTGSNPEVANCVVWSNGPLGSGTGEGQIRGTTWSYSLVEGGTTLDGNLNVDPQFVNPFTDFALIATSPAVDAGTNLAVEAAAYSIEHGRRMDDSPHAGNTGQGTGYIVDMGAYEYSSLAARYDCAAVPNSTGESARIRAEGSRELFVNNFALQAEGLPANQFGFFLASRTQGLVFLPGISSGSLCLAGQIGRFNKSYQILNSGNLGVIGLPINLRDIPQPQGSVSALAGETWYFQAWFRDSVSGMGDSNFSDRAAVEFE